MKHRTFLVAAPLVGLVVASWGPAQGQPPAAPDEGPVLPHCLVALIAQAQVPGREPGVLMALEAKEGMQVSKGMVLGKIDDNEARIQRDIKFHEHAAAKAQAEDDIEVRYAQKASDVAYFTWQKSVEANRSVSNVVVKVELRRLELDFQRAKLGIEQAQLKQKIAASTAQAKQAEWQFANLSVDRRLIKSPYDGVVDKVHKRVGEWVAPGDPVLRIFRFDRLHVKGSLDATKYSPHEIKGKGVSVEIELARGRRIKATGRIVNVSPEVRLDGGYEVWAEVPNRLENGEYIIRPGMPATMTIHVGNLAPAAAAVPRPRGR